MLFFSELAKCPQESLNSFKFIIYSVKIGMKTPSKPILENHKIVWKAFKCSLKGPVKLYDPFAAELTVQNGLLLKGSRLVIPASTSKRLDILDKLDAGHQGIVKCRFRTRGIV